MLRFIFHCFIVFGAFGCVSCSAKTPPPAGGPVKTERSGNTKPATYASEKLATGADQLDKLLPLLKDKRVALLVNNTSLIGKSHLADTLLDSGVIIKKIFAPEHGFRGTSDAGEQVKDGVDVRTGIPLISLYGKNKKPTSEQLQDIDIVVFDIQDVGVRFYTYISTMHYVMEACAENNKILIVLDRPNPNGSYIDGPVLEPEFRSFLGMHTIPLVHGLTVGELAQMINGESWLADQRKCLLKVITMLHWTHSDSYSLPAKPSPNLPNDQAIRLYPSLGLFEGTVISVGRGTEMPFQILGHPDLQNMPFEFTPVSIPGMSKNPPHENKICHGIDLRSISFEPHLTLKYLLDFYQAFPDKNKFFDNASFDKHMGTSKMRQQIVSGLKEDEIRASWQPDLEKYKHIREKYLLYP
jgi:uncharacterized protein YbbC (DUF1343 family)